MRLLLVPDGPLEHFVPSSDAALAVAPPSDATGSGAPGDAHRASKCFVWEVSPNIPLASPIHLLKLRRLFAWSRSFDHLHLFRVLWLQQQGSLLKGPFFRVGPYLDPSRTAYQLGLKEESALFLTSNPASALLEGGDGKLLQNADDQSIAALWNELLLLPLSTAALQWTFAGRDVRIVGSTNRRVWRTGGSATFSRHAFAVAMYPDLFVPESVKVTSRGTAAGVSDDVSSTKVEASLSSGATVLRWSVRVSYRAVPQPGNGAKKPPATRQAPADWPPPLPSETFFQDDNSSDGAVAAVAAAGATPMMTRSSLPDDESTDTTTTVVHQKQRKASVFVRSAEDESDAETPSTQQALGDGASVGRQAAADRSHIDGNDEDEVSEEEDERVGVPLPSMLVGLGVRSVVDEYQALVEQQAQQSASSSSSASGASDAQPLYLVPQLRDAVCMVELCTGAIYASTSPKQLIGWTELESGSCCCDVDTTLTFVVDCAAGSVNLYDGQSVMIAAFTLPPSFVELVQESASTSPAGRRERWLSPEAAAVVPIVQLGSVGAVVDIF